MLSQNKSSHRGSATTRLILEHLNTLKRLTNDDSENTHDRASLRHGPGRLQHQQYAQDGAAGSDPEEPRDAGPRHDAQIPMAWLAAAVFTLSCKYFYEAIMAEDDDEDHGKRE